MVLKQYVKGEVILTEGSVGDRTFQIRSGEVLICKMVSTDQHVPLAHLKAGEVFGEMYLFDQNNVRNATAVAATDVTLEVIFQAELESQLQHLKPNIQLILSGLSQRLSKVSRQFIVTQRHNSHFRRVTTDKGPC